MQKRPQYTENNAVAVKEKNHKTSCPLRLQQITAEFGNLSEFLQAKEIRNSDMAPKISLSQCVLSIRVGQWKTEHVQRSVHAEFRVGDGQHHNSVWSGNEPADPKRSDVLLLILPR